MKIKTSRKLLLSVACSSLLVLLIQSCALFLPAKTTPVEQLKIGVYDFSPPQTTSEKSGITLAFIAPSYSSSFKYYGFEPFTSFTKAMEKDFEELIIARGYTIKGPYNVWDEMVYSDKKGADMFLNVTIDMDINVSNVLCKSYSHYSSKYGSIVTEKSFDGSIILGGKINLTLAETFTREKLWVKSIPLQQKSIQVNSYNTDYSDCYMDKLEVWRDVGINNPVVTVLEDYYKSAMQLAWNQLDPDELKSLLPQVQELKKGK